MRSIQARFLNFCQKRPYHSSLINFAGAVRGQKFSAEMISRWFSKLVEVDDYEQHDRQAVLRHLVLLSEPREDNRKQGKFAP